MVQAARTTTRPGEIYAGALQLWNSRIFYDFFDFITWKDVFEHAESEKIGFDRALLLSFWDNSIFVTKKYANKRKIDVFNNFHLKN